MGPWAERNAGKNPQETACTTRTRSYVDKCEIERANLDVKIRVDERRRRRDRRDRLLREARVRVHVPHAKERVLVRLHLARQRRVQGVADDVALADDEPEQQFAFQLRCAQLRVVPYERTSGWS